MTLTDGDEVFELHRLVGSAEHPLNGGWSMRGEDALVLFAFTDTQYLMWQQSEADDSGQPGIEFGTYNYNLETGAVVVDTQVDTNGEWGLSHPCGVFEGHPESNDLHCGPEGREIVQTKLLAIRSPLLVKQTLSIIMVRKMRKN